jgi:hypothetical protein
MDKFKRKFGQNMGWATFLAIFSQTHLVTLANNNFQVEQGELKNCEMDLRKKHSLALKDTKKR